MLSEIGQSQEPIDMLQIAVLQAVVRNPNTPIETLERLLSDPDTCQEAAANPSLPRGSLAMWQLARDAAHLKP